MNSFEHDLLPFISGMAIILVTWFIFKVAGIMDD